MQLVAGASEASARGGFKTDASSLMYYSMILLAMSIPLSEFGMSISQFLMLVFWIHEGAEFPVSNGSAGLIVRNYLSTIAGNLVSKFRQLFRNPAALAVISLYLMHVAGLLYSSDVHYALKDLRIKLPLLSLPVILATSRPLGRQRFTKLLIFFIFAVFSGTIASIWVLLTRHVSDPREISIFISHIRFGLTICLSFFILIYFLYKNIFVLRWKKILIAATAVWFFFFLIILESLTGLVISGLLFYLFILYFILRIKASIPRYSLFLLVLISPVFAISAFVKKAHDFYAVKPVDLSKLDKYTRYGALYVHDTCSYGIEKGRYVGLYIAPVELRYGWNKRSNLDFDGYDHKNQKLSYTLIRYLNSKGLRKDAEGLSKLSNSEINQIENGVADAAYLGNFSLSSRLDQMIMGYNNYIRHGDPNASSVMQRVEYWKTSAFIISHHWLTGVGTGDLNEAFSEAYKQMGSKLEDAYRNRSHNQFLAIFIALGIIGLLIFIFSLVYPMLITGKYHSYYYMVFFAIVVMSMLTEDTLETQAGATFFAFFNAFLLFSCQRKAHENGEPDKPL